ncbi:DDE-type integrase/transposase/recombinase [Bacillus mycoides]|uniref:DDE-type integrase/transposase/recombinase n=1 Tax=Bacillus mycoides TaxID=1405 RepID=UPI001F230F93|nr:DDE-type integrase/transposase/recombinase [Bacillus mycoides]
MILVAVFLEVIEIMKKRGISVHPTTIMRWVHEYGSLIYQIWNKKNGLYTHTKHCTIKHLNNLIEQDPRHVKHRFVKSSEFQTLRHASRTIKGIETIQALYKQRRSLQPDPVFSAYNELQQLLTTA